MGETLCKDAHEPWSSGLMWFCHTAVLPVLLSPLGAHSEAVEEEASLKVAPLPLIGCLLDEVEQGKLHNSSKPWNCSELQNHSSRPSLCLRISAIGSVRSLLTSIIRKLPKDIHVHTMQASPINLLRNYSQSHFSRLFTHDSPLP